MPEKKTDVKAESKPKKTSSRSSDELIGRIYRLRILISRSINHQTISRYQAELDGLMAKLDPKVDLEEELKKLAKV